MKTYITGALVLVLLVIGFAFLPQNERAAQQAPVTSPLVIVEPSFDFGDIDIFGGKVRTTYTLKNEGEDDILILSGVTSCACTEGIVGLLQFGMHESSGDTVIIPAGGEETLTAIYDPLAHGPNATGAVTRELMLKTNSSVTPEVRARLTANVVKYQ